jgi:hypothetical protein
MLSSFPDPAKESAIEHSDPKAAEQLLPFVYRELRRLASFWDRNGTPRGRVREEKDRGAPDGMITAPRE